MPITFRNLRMHDFNAPLTVEDAFRFYGSFSGIHDFDFDSLYVLTGTGWVPSAGVVTGFVTGVTGLSLNATGLSASWHFALQGTELPADHAIYYHKTQHRQGVIVGAQTDGTHYLVSTDSSGFPNIYHYDGAAYTLKRKTPLAAPEEADVIVTFRQFALSDSDEDNLEQVWRTISLWMNDALIDTYTEKAESLIQDNVSIGFAVYGNESITYTGIRVPELTQIAEYGTIDAGSTPIEGLQRVIEGRYLKYFIRWNGSLRAWRPKSVDVAMEIPRRLLFTETPNTDLRQLKTHIRMEGAYIWAEYRDTELERKYQHRFRVDNNPMLLSERECYDEAVFALRRVQEEVFTLEIDLPSTPLLELEDRIVTVSGDWLISGRSVDWVRGRGRQNISARKYTWG